ncbi:chemotaxis protein CheY [Clostridium saccharobutylicum DSM 13864]|uniref:Stage 0 sporulation protein A homolog n=2 Tax=Clostridium saccharobutylicum TaxID=169679 RepID=U5MRK9_CLOSA|nr:chemotaxis protein CheY [Clostridium saccharobutylicum DSM 13864]
MIMKRVLIVDDAAFMRVTLKSMLENNGFEVVGEAENGIIGVQKYVELNPDVVTMDITMPEMSGIDALKEMKKINPNVKVVMISAMGQDMLIRESVIAGAKSFIVKPFKEEFMVKTLTQVLGI